MVKSLQCLLMALCHLDTQDAVHTLSTHLLVNSRLCSPCMPFQLLATFSIHLSTVGTRKLKQSAGTC